MGAESGMNSSVRDDRVALSDGAKALWGKTNRIDDSEWLPLYVHMVDSAAMASKIWDTWVPQGTKAVIVGDLGNDEVLARKLMIFMAGIHDIGKATPVFQAKSITFGPEAGSFAWKAERAGLPMIAGLRGTNHPTHPIAGEIILEGYLLRVRGWERKAARQYACVVGGHHGTPPDKSKIDEEKNRKTNVGLDSEAWVSTQDELIDFVANIDTKFDSERYRLFGNNQDIPVWEREDPPSTDLNDQNRFVGPVQAMTWQSRRVRLVPSEDNARIIGIMSCYGDVVAPYNTDVFEKMTAWRSSVTQQKKLGLPAPPHMPVVHDAGKALWRGLEPILCASDEGDSRPGLIRWLEEIRTEILESEKHVLDLVTIHAQGMTYGTQSSVFETGIDDTLSLNSVMFRHDYSGIASVLDVVKCTDGAVLALSQFVRNLRAASGDKGKSTETAEQVREWAYADLDGLFRDELAAFDETQDPIEYANAWKDEIHRRLLQMGWEYLDQSSVPVFGEHESGVVGVMGASRAQLLFQSKLNKELGFLEEKDASRPNKGGM